MKLLVLVLNKTEKLNDILEGFLDLGIRGATVIDSTGMGRILSPHVPIFGGLSHLFSGDRPPNKVVFSLIQEKEKLDKALGLVKEKLNYLTEPGTGILFVLDVEQVLGLAEDIRD